MKDYGIAILLLITIIISSCSEPNVVTIDQQKWLKEKQLNYALTDSTGHNSVDNKRIIIKTKETAICVIEPILFDLYKKREHN